jgi:hypothetical protein
MTDSGVTRITSATTLAELASIVSEALQAAGIVATLSGGSAVSLYTQNRYESEDLDFVTTAMLEDLRPVLEPLGFVHTGTPRLSVFEADAFGHGPSDRRHFLARPSVPRTGVLVAGQQEPRVNWEEVGDWVKREAIAGSPEVVEFYRRVKRALA